jgi:Domain of unknown function (DUF4390)
MLALVLAPVQAADTHIRIHDVYLDAQSDVLLLNAQLDLALPEGARAAVREGSALTFDIQFELRRSRSFWRDEIIASLTQRYVLSFHALSERYILRNLNSGDQTTFGSIDAALELINDINALPALDRDLLVKGTTYQARLRAELDVHTLPESLRFVLFWADNWKQSSDWFLWQLKL